MLKYLAEGGPLEMLERRIGTDEPRLVFRGRLMFPERLHSVALAIDVLTRVLGSIENWFRVTAEAVDDGPGTTEASLTDATRARLKHVAARRS